jgi:hypothetical protein
MNAEQILEQTQAQIAKRFENDPQMPVKVINSLQRKVAHIEKTSTNKVTVSTWKKALTLAEKALAEAHADHFVPCDSQCMSSAHKECVCHCGGKNHGVLLKQAVAV